MSIRDKDIYTATPGHGWRRKIILAAASLVFGVVLGAGIRWIGDVDPAVTPSPSPSASESPSPAASR